MDLADSVPKTSKRVAKGRYQSRVALNFPLQSRVTENFFANYA